MVTPEIQEINRIVRRYLNVYEFRITPDHLEFYFVIDDQARFERNFEALRLELKGMDAIPMVRKSGAEYVLLVLKNPPRRYMSIWVNVALLIATIISTIWVGMGYYVAYYGSSGLWNDVLGGLIYFSVPLLTILGCHEMGHYLAAKKHNVAASLPFFIPAPTMLGTLGAFISIREPIPDRKALIDIGLAGPIVGFLVAIPVTALGMYLGGITHPHLNLEATNTYMILNMPLIYDLLGQVLPSPNFVHPVAMAGWVGFIVTAINLFPIGQLDGGHAIRAVLGENAKYVSYGFIAILFFLGIFYPGWLFFGLLVLFLGLRHPPPLNEVVKLDGKRIAIALAALIIFAVTFVPVPVEIHQVHEDVRMSASLDDPVLILGEKNSTILRVNITNLGEMRENVTLKIEILGVNATINYSAVFSVDSNSSRVISRELAPDAPGNYTISVHIRTKTAVQRWENLTLTVLEKSSTLEFIPEEVHGGDFNVTLRNTGERRRVHIISENNVSFNITNMNSTALWLDTNGSVEMHIIALGSTTLLAVDYSTYEAATLRVIIP